MLAKHGRHLHFLTIVVLLLGNGPDRIAEGRQAAVGKDSVAQQTPPPQAPPKHTVTGQVADLALKSADDTRLAVAVTGKKGQKTIEFRMDRHSKATTPGLKKGATVVVIYHDYRKVHLVSFVRVLPTAPTLEQSTIQPPLAPSGQASPASKQNSTPLSTKQGAVAENIPPGVFEKDYRQEKPLTSTTSSSGLGALLGGKGGYGKSTGAGATTGSASSTTSSGNATASGKTGASAAASSSSGTSENERGIKTVTGKVISWGAEFLLLEAKGNMTDEHAVVRVFLTEDTEFEREVTLDDDVVVSYAKRRGENIAISVNIVHPSTGVKQ
jgi:hypothetical protein